MRKWTRGRGLGAPTASTGIRGGTKLGRAITLHLHREIPFAGDKGLLSLGVVFLELSSEVDAREIKSGSTFTQLLESRER